MTTGLKHWWGRADLWSAWPAIAFAGVLTIIQFAGDGLVSALIYDRASVTNGQWWRLASGHLVHLGGQHTVWNIGSYLLMAVMAHRTLAIGYGRQFAVMAAGAAAISLILWLRGANVLAYSGLSGVLNALLAPILIESWRQTHDPLTLVVAGLSVAKIGFEAITGSTLFVAVPWPASAEAHAGGLGAGLLAAIVGGSVESRLSAKRALDRQS